MKNILITTILLLLVAFISFKFAYWLGFETGRMQAEDLYRPTADLSSITNEQYYNQYILKNCLIENKILKNQ